MRFLHSADWHLGKMLSNFNLIEDQTYVLKEVLKLVDAEKPDLFLLAGDIYDKQIPSLEAMKLFDWFVSELVKKRGVPLIAIAGNHDNPDRVGYLSSAFNEGELVLAGRMQWPLRQVVFGDTRFWLFPYTDPEAFKFHAELEVETHDDVFREIASYFNQNKPMDGLKNVLVAHAFVQGGEASDSERELSVGGADKVSSKHLACFDYVALGHLHKSQSFANQVVNYSGSPLKYSLSEVKHHKSLLSIDLNGDGINIDTIPLVPLRDVRQVKGNINEQLTFILEQGVREPSKDDYLYVELDITSSEHFLNLRRIIEARYPNILGISIIGQEKGVGVKSSISSEALLDWDKLSVFEKFFSENFDKKLTVNQKDILRKLIEEP